MKEELSEEKVLLDFLSYLDGCVFIKSTNSVTGEEEQLEPIIEDMEAIIKLSGEWDREDLKCFFQSILSAQRKALLEETKEEIGALEINTPEQLAELNKDLPSTLQIQALNESIGYVKALTDAISIVENKLKKE